jgi:hypothetical protein
MAVAFAAVVLVDGAEVAEIYHTAGSLEVAAGENRRVRVSPVLSLGSIADVEKEITSQKVRSERAIWYSWRGRHFACHLWHAACLIPTLFY